MDSRRIVDFPQRSFLLNWNVNLSVKVDILLDFQFVQIPRLSRCDWWWRCTSARGGRDTIIPMFCLTDWRCRLFSLIDNSPVIEEGSLPQLCRLKLCRDYVLEIDTKHAPPTTTTTAYAIFNSLRLDPLIGPTDVARHHLFVHPGEEQKLRVIKLS